jgi:hypothetical protein
VAIRNPIAEIMAKQSAAELENEAATQSEVLRSIQNIRTAKTFDGMGRQIAFELDAEERNLKDTGNTAIDANFTVIKNQMRLVTSHLIKNDKRFADLNVNINNKLVQITTINNRNIDKLRQEAGSQLSTINSTLRNSQRQLSLQDSKIGKLQDDIDFLKLKLEENELEKKKKWGWGSQAKSFAPSASTGGGFGIGHVVGAGAAGALAGGALGAAATAASKFARGAGALVVGGAVAKAGVDWQQRAGETYQATKSRWEKEGFSWYEQLVYGGPYTWPAAKERALRNLMDKMPMKTRGGGGAHAYANRLPSDVQSNAEKMFSARQKFKTDHERRRQQLIDQGKPWEKIKSWFSMSAHADELPEKKDKGIKSDIKKMEVKSDNDIMLSALNRVMIESKREIVIKSDKIIFDAPTIEFKSNNIQVAGGQAIRGGGQTKARPRIRGGRGMGGGDILPSGGPSGMGTSGPSYGSGGGSGGGGWSGTVGSSGGPSAGDVINAAQMGDPTLPSTMIDDALKLQGLHEGRDREQLKQYLAKGGQGMDPSTTKWCAAFVGSTLQQHGIKGTGSNMAVSYTKWGQAVDSWDNLQKGDVLARNGHVGFYTGDKKMFGKEERFGFLSGNSGNKVEKTWVRRGSYAARRAIIDQKQAQPGAAMPGGQTYQLPGGQQVPGQIPVDPKTGRVDKQAYYNAAVQKIANSKLNGFVPKDGAKYGIDGSPESWAKYMTRMTSQESSFNTRTTNSGDPGGSLGLLQFGQHYGITRENWQDPSAQIDAFVNYSDQWVVNGGGYILPPAGVEAKRYKGHGGMGAIFSTARHGTTEKPEHIAIANQLAAGGITTTPVPGQQDPVINQRMPGGYEAEKVDVSKRGLATARQGYTTSQVNELQGKVAGIRKRPLDPKLKSVLDYTAAQTGVEVDVISGGQPRKGEGGDRTGSTRHDHGRAADFDLYIKDENGARRKLDFNKKEDLPYFQSFAKTGAQMGLTGMGAGNEYMGPGRLHMGYGKPATWGSLGKGNGWLAKTWREGFSQYNPKQAEATLASYQMAKLGGPPLAASNEAPNALQRMQTRREQSARLADAFSGPKRKNIANPMGGISGGKIVSRPVAPPTPKPGSSEFWKQGKDNGPPKGPVPAGPKPGSKEYWEQGTKNAVAEDTGNVSGDTSGTAYTGGGDSSAPAPGDNGTGDYSYCLI